MPKPQAERLAAGRQSRAASTHAPPPPLTLPPSLLQAFLSILLEERVLLVSHEPLLLARACNCLLACLHPLEFCGACVPLLPEGLHPHLDTLLNEAVEPFIVGLLTSLHSKLKPLLTDDIVTIDLDAGTVSGGSSESATECTTMDTATPATATPSAARV